MQITYFLSLLFFHFQELFNTSKVIMCMLKCIVVVVLFVAKRTLKHICQTPKNMLLCGLFFFRFFLTNMMKKRKKLANVEIKM